MSRMLSDLVGKVVTDIRLEDDTLDACTECTPYASNVTEAELQAAISDYRAAVASDTTISPTTGEDETSSSKQATSSSDIALIVVFSTVGLAMGAAFAYTYVHRQSARVGPDSDADQADSASNASTSRAFSRTPAAPASGAPASTVVVDMAGASHA